MQTVARRQRARFHAEFLQRVGEGERHVHVREAVVVIAAIQQIVGRIPRAARDGDRLRTEEALTARVRAVAVIDRRAGDGDQLRRIPSVQRQIDNALLVHHLRNTALLRLHQRGARLHFHAFGYRPDLHVDIDLHLIADAQQDAVLHVRLKAGAGRLQSIGSNGQTRDGVHAVRIVYRGGHRPRLHAGHPDLRAGDGSPLFIGNTAVDRSDGHRLRQYRGSHCQRRGQRKQSHSNNRIPLEHREPETSGCYLGNDCISNGTALCCFVKAPPAARR